MPLFEEKDPINPAGFQTALERTQGNILKSHGRPHTINAFLTFHGPASDVKSAIHGLADRVTSAWQQSLQRPEDQALFVGFGLSAEGYSRLGVSLDGFSPEFRGGMTRADSGLLDPDEHLWEPAFQGELHAMILLAHADAGALCESYAQLTAPFRNLALIHAEWGSAIYQSGQPAEHFGFLDGISQPLFFQGDVDKVAANGGIDPWDPSAGPKLVLVQDPHGQTEDDCGTYYVFRKLDQDVQAFQAKVNALRTVLDQAPTPDPHPEFASAAVVGRFGDGTPLALSPEPAQDRANNFIYTRPDKASGTDPFERRCPLAAHIRKVNPRGDTGDIKGERTHRIARRGITYGIPGGREPVGLLFQCCQSDLKKQFEFLQSQWINSTEQPAHLVGFDPIAATEVGSQQKWLAAWDSRRQEQFAFGGFVTLKGGAYFFLPSKTFLQAI